MITVEYIAKQLASQFPEHNFIPSDRISYKGTIAELREILREVLDYLAPDKEVIATPGFKLEKDRFTPTMKQRVRHVLRSRKKSEASTDKRTCAPLAWSALISWCCALTLI